MKKLLFALILSLISNTALAVPLNIQLEIVQQPAGPFPGPQYYFYGQPADINLQSNINQFADVYYIATPADPANNVYVNLADAQAAFLATSGATMISTVNSNYGTSYTSIGTVSPFNQQLQNALAAVTPVTKSVNTVTRTIGGSATQCTNSASDCLVIFSLTQAQTISLSGGQAGTISGQTSPTSGGSYTEFSRIGNGNSGTLTVGLNVTNTGTNVLLVYVPAGYYYKLVASGTGTNTYVTGKELTF